MLDYAASVIFIRAGCVRLKREHQRSVKACRRYGGTTCHILTFVVGTTTTAFSARGHFFLDLKQTKQFEGTEFFLRS